MTVLTLKEAAEQLARALVYAAREHGLPNRFRFGELASMYGGPPPLIAGKAALLYRDYLEQALWNDGWKDVRVYYNGQGTPLTIEGRE